MKHTPAWRIVALGSILTMGLAATAALSPTSGGGDGEAHEEEDD